MINCMLDMKNSTIEFMVGLYGREPSQFSPLVEIGSEPIYTNLEGDGGTPEWEIDNIWPHERQAVHFLTAPTSPFSTPHLQVWYPTKHVTRLG